ncbi:hypothetical protein ABIA16_001726 [Sinorhizobium fredii]
MNGKREKKAGERAAREPQGQGLTAARPLRHGGYAAFAMAVASSVAFRPKA